MTFLLNKKYGKQKKNISLMKIVVISNECLIHYHSLFGERKYRQRLYFIFHSLLSAIAKNGFFTRMNI